jgi:hypothetical protein
VGRKPDEHADATFDGTRPDEEVGPSGASAQAPRCETGASRNEGVEDSEFQKADEIHESFPVEPLTPFIAPDGLPSFNMPTPEETEAIPFTYETVVCVEDDREFVELFHEELEDRGWYGDENGWTSPASFGAEITLVVRSRHDDEGLDRERLVFKPQEAEHRWGVWLIDVGAGRWTPVRMRRERCEHYRRQVFSNDDVPNPEEFGHQLVFRNCTARRSNGGAYLSLRDEGIYACDYRKPYDEPSCGRQDRIDSKKLREQPHKIRVPLFGLPGEDVHLEDNHYEQQSGGDAKH